jgi:imidazolonepropionase-like amidohydrolase
MTSSAAEIVRVDDRIGALDVGRDGDVVIWSGDPLEVASRVLRVFIDGIEVHAAEAG